MRLIENDNDIFASYDIRKALIDNVKKYSDVPLTKACEAVGIDYMRFFKEYMMVAHPDKDYIASFVNVVSFKNLLTLFGLSIKNVLYLTSTDYSIDESQRIIGERIKKSRALARKSTGLNG